MYETFTLLVLHFQASFLALNKWRGDAHKPDEKTVRTFYSSLQWHQILLMCFLLNPMKLTRHFLRGFASNLLDQDCRLKLAPVVALVVQQGHILSKKVWREQSTQRCIFLLLGCVNPASWLPLTSGTSFTQPLREKYSPQSKQTWDL